MSTLHCITSGFDVHKSIAHAQMFSFVCDIDHSYSVVPNLYITNMNSLAVFAVLVVIVTIGKLN